MKIRKNSSGFVCEPLELSNNNKGSLPNNKQLSVKWLPELQANKLLVRHNMYLLHREADLEAEVEYWKGEMKEDEKKYLKQIDELKKELKDTKKLFSNMLETALKENEGIGGEDLNGAKKKYKNLMAWVGIKGQWDEYQAYRNLVDNGAK